MPHERALSAEWGAAPVVATAVPRSKSAAVLRAAFSFPAMLCLALAALTVLTVRGRFNDPDLWWHLKVGEIIWTTHAIPHADQFSFTAANHAWIAHEWLSEAIIYAAYRAGGYTGLMVWLCALPSILFALVYALGSLYSGNAKISLLGGMAAWFFGTIGLAIRPHILGYLFLALELLIVHLGRTRGRRWFWALAPLFAVWANCHGSFALGLLLLAIFLGCSFIEMRAGSLVSERWPAEDRKRLAAAALVSVGALFVNPLGWRLVLYPFNLFFQQSQNLASVSEWQPLDVHDPRAWVLGAVAVGIFLAVLLRRAELRLEELAMLAAGFGLAILHQRMLFVFGILAAPVICRLLANAWDKYDPARDLRFANAILMAAAVVTMIAAFPGAGEIQQQIAKTSPAGAVDYIRKSGLEGRMLNEYIFGGYLIWALPEQKVFIDGRCDIFDWTGVLGEYGGWYTLSDDPERLLKKYHIDYCLLGNGAPELQVLPHLAGWRKVYQDKVATIFARTK
jgi:hypothetical protein